MTGDLFPAEVVIAYTEALVRRDALLLADLAVPLAEWKHQARPDFSDPG